MGSKLSWHHIGDPSPAFDDLNKARPKIAKLLDFDSEQTIDALKGIVPIVIFRLGVDENYHNISPQDFVNRIPAKIKGKGLVFEGINEPVISTADQAKALNDWYVQFAQIMHSMGERVAAYSFSTGNPNMDLVQYLADGARACDWIAMHEYWKPEGVGYSQIGRYEQFLSLLPADARKQVFITETGADNGGCRDCGWQALGVSAAQYLDILKQIDARYLANDWCAGATIFQYGGGIPWDKFNIAPISKQLATYIQSVGGGVLPPKPTTPPPSVEPTVSFVATPPSIDKGASSLLQWDVSGGTQVRLDGAVVPAKGSKSVSPVSTTIYRLEVDY